MGKNFLISNFWNFCFQKIRIFVFKKIFFKFLEKIFSVVDLYLIRICIESNKIFYM